VPAVEFLRGRLRPVSAAASPRVRRLIADLDDDRFAVRERAAAELTRLAHESEPAVRQALGGRPSQEARRRLEGVLNGLEREVPSPELLQALRAVEALERAGTPEARRLLAELAGGAAEAWLTREATAALKRLGR
jgi:hypothetical protein